MKFSFTNADVSQAPPDFTIVRLTEEKTTRFLSEEGREILEFGIGRKRTEVNRRRFALILRSIIQTAKQHRRPRSAIGLNKSPFPQLGRVPLPELASLIAQNFELANFEYREYKTPPPEGFSSVEEVLICGAMPPAMKKGFERGKLIGEEVNACRTLANTPGGDMTPKKLAEAAKEAVKGTKVEVTVLGQNALENLKMGAILGVARGSQEEPQFIIMEYWGASPSTRAARSGQSKPLVLIGKGVTFDSGGLNVKPGDSMYEMHMDMSGGAAVIHAVALAAKLGLKK